MGEQYPDYATTLGSLALLYMAMGDNAKAEPLLIQCRDVQKATIGEQHPVYATTLSYLAELYMRTRDYTKAEPLLI